jgi:protein-tyrosine phosphatase
MKTRAATMLCALSILGGLGRLSFGLLLAACSSESLQPAGRQPQAPEESGCSPGHFVLQDDVLNARDLGGVPVAGGAVACGELFRGPPLAALTDQGCANVASLGIRRLIDLRVPAERDLKPESSCIGNSVELVLAPLPVPYGLSTADYIADLYTTDSIALAFRTLADDASYPLYFHCTWGRYRTGILAAIILLALGATRDDVIAEYSLSSSVVGAYPASLAGMLDEIESLGGIAAYLAMAGVPTSTVDALRARVVREPLTAP